VTVIVFFTVGLYDVELFVDFGIPMSSSTPGGSEIGVRPSFDGRGDEVENWRGVDACHAGTRNAGSVIFDDDGTAWRNACLPVGASIVVIRLGETNLMSPIGTSWMHARTIGDFLKFAKSASDARISLVEATTSIRFDWDRVGTAIKV
jgi:hypothetical protein